MSLFSSSFEGSSSAGPSLSKSNTSGGGKRKRPSLGDGKDGQIRSTTANLQKLMKKVEGGNVASPKPRPGNGKVQKRGNGEGGEAIGVISKKQARKSFGDEEEDTPRKSNFESKGNDSKGKKNDGNGNGNGNGKKTDQSPASKKSKTMTDKTKEKEKDETPKKSSKSGSKVEPAELQLPHTIRADHEGSKEDEGLTKMQKDMKAKLEGARFRWINEQLYSTPSTEAVEMMQKDPKIFSDYHLTHRALTSAWPQPPLPHLISLLTPLPASTVIADLGCGDAGLAKALVPQGKIVLSYDLVGDRGMVGGGKGEGWVVEADFLTSVPLPGRTGLGGAGAGIEKSKRRKGKGKEEASEIVDVVVCCLSLMGTNWIGGIYEACRILKPGGTLHIAEVTSRFVSTESFTSAITSFGFELNDESSPSTHFTLFEFTKAANVPVGPVKGEAGWEKRVKAGGEILRACVYKKR